MGDGINHLLTIVPRQNHDSDKRCKVGWGAVTEADLLGKDAAMTSLERYEARIHTQDASPGFTPRLAGLIDEHNDLDLVISVQTAVVHLAGALGKPAWVLVPVVPEWRYMAQGARMPWYPTVNLVRQTVRGDWASVCRDVVQSLT